MSVASWPHARPSRTHKINIWRICEYPPFEQTPIGHRGEGGRPEAKAEGRWPGSTEVTRILYLFTKKWTSPTFKSAFLYKKQRRSSLKTNGRGELINVNKPVCRLCLEVDIQWQRKEATHLKHDHQLQRNLRYLLQNPFSTVQIQQTWPVDASLFQQHHYYKRSICSCTSSISSCTQSGNSATWWFTVGT